MRQHFSWQSAVLESDLESTTKLVLLVIGSHMNQHGKGAFPSYATIAKCASLGRSTAIKHVEKALEAGWIRKKSRTKLDRADGKVKHDSNEYEITYPASLIQGDQVVHHVDQGVIEGGPRGIPPSPPDGPPSISGEPGVVHQVDPNTPLLTPHLTPQLSLSPDGFCEPTVAAEMPGPKDPTTKTYQTWCSYAQAYHKRYKCYPIWNRANAGKIAQVVERLGKDVAPVVAAFYLTINDSFYVRKMHPVGNLLADCESIYTQWATGRTMTQRQAMEVDRRQSTGNIAVSLAERLRAQGKLA